MRRGVHPADKIIHSTVIDKPMYAAAARRGSVIADLSTSNANAIYELGVRHALKPHTTFVMAENNFAFPFDLNHLTILKYTHLGPDIGFDEVMRVREELQKRIKALIDKGEVDSPVLHVPAPAAGQGPGGEQCPRPHRPRQRRTKQASSICAKACARPSAT